MAFANSVATAKSAASEGPIRYNPEAKERSLDALRRGLILPGYSHVPFEVELQEIVLATKRKKRRLRGKDKIALRVGRLIERFKMAKHFVPQIEQDAFGWQRDETKIAEEAALDGIYVVRTSVDQSAMSASEAVERYKDLGAVEQAFRCFKTRLTNRPRSYPSSERRSSFRGRLN
jgi:hypothetical protein